MVSAEVTNRSDGTDRTDVSVGELRRDAAVTLPTLSPSRLPGILFGRLVVERVDQPHRFGFFERLVRRVVWRPVEDVVIQYHRVGVIVPAGRLTDWASVPRPVQWLLSERAIFSVGALVHDYLYFMGTFSRAVSDAVFMELLKAEGVGVFDRWMMYLAVRACGRSAWDRHRRLGHPTRNEGVF